MMLIIGGNSDIGQAVIRKTGAVIATYHGEKPDIPGQWVKVDMLSGKQALTTISQGNYIDTILYLPAAPNEYKTVFDVTKEEMDRHLSIDALGLLDVVQAMREQIIGHPVHIIVMLTAYCTGDAPTRLLPYITGKYALMGIAKALQAELARYRCRVNMISPGMVNTKYVPEKIKQMMTEKDPMKRLTEPEEIADRILWLASPKASHMAGANILMATLSEQPMPNP